MRCTILGCATSIGVPIVGCPCAVCHSSDLRDQRTRVSVYIAWEGLGILVDTSPDLRQQLLREKITKIDHVLFTHTHADHIFGLDDLRPIHFVHQPEIPIWGLEKHLQRIQEIFPYAFGATSQQGPVPCLRPQPVQPGQIFLDKQLPGVMPVLCEHGNDEVVAYRFGPLVYATDVSAISAASRDLLSGAEVLILGALRDRPHPKHFTVDQALATARELNAKRVVLTHMGHELSYKKLGQRLPDFAEPAFDGMNFEI